MISFDLRCDGGHVFEAWFRSSADHAAQADRRQIICPLCGSSSIAKAAMAPNVAAKGNAAPPPRAEPRTDPAAPPTVGAPAAGPPVPSDMRTLMARIAAEQARALPESTWVGRRFAEEARAAHDAGDDAPRTIHGEATPEEARALAEDGIPVLPLLVPFAPPEARN